MCLCVFVCVCVCVCLCLCLCLSVRSCLSNMYVGPLVRVSALSLTRVPCNTYRGAQRTRTNTRAHPCTWFLPARVSVRWGRNSTERRNNQSSAGGVQRTGGAATEGTPRWAAMVS